MSIKNFASLPNNTRDSDNIFFSNLLLLLSICLVMALTTLTDPVDGKQYWLKQKLIKDLNY